MSRPRKQIDIAEIGRLRQQRLSWPVIASRMGCGVGTAHRAYQKATDVPLPFQNLSKTVLCTKETDVDAIKTTVQGNAVTSDNQSVREAPASPMNSHVYELRYDRSGQPFLFFGEEARQGEAIGELVARIEVLRCPVSAKVFEEPGHICEIPPPEHGADGKLQTLNAPPPPKYAAFKDGSVRRRP